METHQGARFLTILHETLGRIDNPVQHVIKADSRAQCAARAQELRKKPRWSLSEVGQLAFYEVAANADLNRTDELFTSAAARLSACLVKLRRSDTDHLWALFGIKPNTPEAEVIKAKEMAATVLHEAQRIQEDSDAKVNHAQAELAEAQHKHQEAMELLQLEKQSLADSFKSDVDLLQLEKEVLADDLKAARTEIETLRAALQTATENQTAKSSGGDIPKDLAAAHALIEQQQRIIEKFQATPMIDDDIKEAAELIAKNFDDPSRKVETKHSVYFLLNSVFGK